MKTYYIYYQPVFSKNEKVLMGYNTAVTQEVDDQAYRSYSRLSVELDSEEKTEAEFKRIERMLYYFRLDGVSLVEESPLRILEYVRGTSKNQGLNRSFGELAGRLSRGEMLVTVRPGLVKYIN